MQKVTLEVLQLWDKYDQDFGLLEERWADEGDRHMFPEKVLACLEQYWSLLHEVQTSAYSDELRLKIQTRLDQLEPFINVTVREELMKRLVAQ